MHILQYEPRHLRACLQGGRVTLAGRLTLAGGQKIARVYKQNFTTRDNLMRGYTQRVWKQQKGFLGRRVNSTHLICIIMVVRCVLCYSSIFYLLMCLLSLHLSGKSFNSASKGIGYDLTTLIVTRDVSTPRIESIFLHPKKSAKASVMASHSKLL